MLMTIEQRLAAFEAEGIDAALVLPFNLELSKVRPEDFARRYLVETMRASRVLVGETSVSGTGRKGTWSRSKIMAGDGASTWRA